MPKIPRIIFFVCVLIGTFAFALCSMLSALSDDKKKDDFWLPMEERVKIWDAVVSEQLSLSPPLPATKPYTVSSNGLEATFEKDGSKWTIVGANAPIVNPTVYPKDWPVKGNDFEVLVIPEPITNYKILPFTEKIENAVKSDTITITAAPDSYEPASFVIRSGDVDLKNVMIEVTDLKAEIKGKDGKKKTAIIPKENIDVRLVKCWYQAGVNLFDIKHKLLTPELLVHDNDIVRVAYDRQLNLIRDLERIEDSERLKSFTIPKKQNKQIWLTAHTKEQFLPGKYHGVIKITAHNKSKKLKIVIEVLSFTLPEPMLDYVLFYDGYLSGNNTPQIGTGPKTEEQMLAELQDMKQHGLTNVTVRHLVNTDRTKWDQDLEQLRSTIQLREKIGWGQRPLLYVDWKTNFSDDLKKYKEKIDSIISLAKEFGIKDVYIYGKDERKGYELFILRPIYKTVHEAGAKNFVACREDFLLFIPDLLDLPILAGNPDDFYMEILNKLGMKVWNYANPQTGLEEPETYRINYGIKLLMKGFSGVCDYIYQHGNPWTEIVDGIARSHTMAYPTINKPIPTIQWEGWREGVNDVKYATLFKYRKVFGKDWLDKNCLDSVKSCRKNLINILSKKEKDYIINNTIQKIVTITSRSH